MEYKSWTIEREDRRNRLQALKISRKTKRIKRVDRMSNEEFATRVNEEEEMEWDLVGDESNVTDSGVSLCDYITYSNYITYSKPYV